jgi:hypothetical protein
VSPRWRQLIRTGICACTTTSESSSRSRFHHSDERQQEKAMINELEMFLKTWDHEALIPSGFCAPCLPRSTSSGRIPTVDRSVNSRGTSPRLTRMSATGSTRVSSRPTAGRRISSVPHHRGSRARVRAGSPRRRVADREADARDVDQAVTGPLIRRFEHSSPRWREPTRCGARRAFTAN